MAEKMPIGTEVEWLTHGYGWSRGKHIPGTVVAHSTSGKRARVKFQWANWSTNEANGLTGLAWVSWHMLRATTKSGTDHGD